MSPWWEISRVDDFYTGSFKKVFTINYKKWVFERQMLSHTKRKCYKFTRRWGKRRNAKIVKDVRERQVFPHRKWGSLPVAEIQQRLHYYPVGMQLFYCALILGHETSRNKILDRLSWQKNRLGKIQSTMNRKTSSWEILSGVPSNVRKSFSQWRHWWFVFFYQRFRNCKTLSKFVHLTHVTAIESVRKRQCVWRSLFSSIFF